MPLDNLRVTLFVLGLANLLGVHLEPVVLTVASHHVCLRTNMDESRTERSREQMPSDSIWTSCVGKNFRELVSTYVTCQGVAVNPLLRELSPGPSSLSRRHLVWKEEG